MEDFNFGTLLRLDCTGDYSEANSVFGEVPTQKDQFVSMINTAFSGFLLSAKYTD